MFCADVRVIRVRVATFTTAGCTRSTRSAKPCRAPTRGVAGVALTGATSAALGAGNVNIKASATAAAALAPAARRGRCVAARIRAEVEGLEFFMVRNLCCVGVDSADFTVSLRVRLACL